MFIVERFGDDCYHSTIVMLLYTSMHIAQLSHTHCSLINEDSLLPSGGFDYKYSP